MTKLERMEEFRGMMGCAGTFTANLCNKLNQMGFFDAPASTKYHGNHEGGLYEHSVAMYGSLVMLTEKLGLEWERRESPFLISMLHDICKCDQYQQKEDGTWEYRKDCLFTGHGEKSLMLCCQLGFKLTEEEMACIRYHMGAFTDKEEWSSYTGAIHKYPNVMWTHQADMMAAHILNT